jgi:hypothetical protein
VVDLTDRDEEESSYYDIASKAPMRVQTEKDATVLDLKQKVLNLLGNPFPVIQCRLRRYIDILSVCANY